jgi:hypothetical protein
MQIWAVELQEGNNMVLDRDVFASPDGQVLQRPYSGLQHQGNKSHAADSRIIQVQAFQPRSYRDYNRYQQRIEGVLLALPFSRVWRLHAWRPKADCRLR